MTPSPHKRPTRPDRRSNAREEVDSPARLRCGETVLEGKVENVGLRGAAFATREMEPNLPIDARVTLVVTGAGDAGADLEFHGRIVRSEEFQDSLGDTRSYALEFDAPIGD